jgi:hypothetical protein
MRQRVCRMGQDATGLLIVHVPLSSDDNPAYATVELHSWKDLLARGMSPAWYVDRETGKPIVWIPALKKATYVSRLVADCGSGESAWHKDGDVLNLRSNNLIKQRTSLAKYRDRDFLVPDYRWPVTLIVDHLN